MCRYGICLVCGVNGGSGQLLRGGCVSMCAGMGHVWCVWLMVVVVSY